MKDYFELCINLAIKASKKGEVPIGAIIVKQNKILSKSYNMREKFHDITAHAEILAIKKAASKMKTWNLSDCDLYVTLKPCTMCENIIKQSRIKNVYFLYDKLDYKKEYNKTNFNYIEGSDLANSYSMILSDFFKNRRKK